VSEPERTSVVVPTRDRPEALTACLAALALQEPPVDVVVVDDGSADEAAVAAVVRAAPRTRLVRLGGRGPAAARNAGVKAAPGAVVCFTDDDCRPGPGWARALAEAVAGGASVAAGPTVVGTVEDHVAAAAQVVTNHLVEESLDDAASTVGFAPTSNLAGERAVLEALPFDERYPAAAGEDRDWCARLSATGRAIAWVPAAVVHHHPSLSLRRFWHQQVRYGRGARQVHASGSGGRAELGFYLRLLRRGWRTGWREGALVAVAQAATAAGYLRGASRRG
jgi:GT2 family glycosyltransferase